MMSTDGPQAMAISSLVFRAARRAPELAFRFDGPRREPEDSARCLYRADSAAADIGVMLMRALASRITYF